MLEIDKPLTARAEDNNVLLNIIRQPFRKEVLLTERNCIIRTRNERRRKKKKKTRRIGECHAFVRAQ